MISLLLTDARKRLAYSWVLVDQEISLFFDLPPILNTFELECRLPSSEGVWLQPNPDEWAALLQKESGTCHDWRSVLPQQSELSLRELFEVLICDRLDKMVTLPEPLHMRLLLFPIQALVTQFAQLANSSTDDPPAMRIHSHSMMLRFDDLQQLMHRWFDVFQRVRKDGFRGQAMANASLVLYHVINLNLFTAFSSLESLARGGNLKECLEDDLKLLLNRIRAPERALVHCAQIFLLMREMSDPQRPIWSAVAVYRATIVLWAISLSELRGLQELDPESTIGLDKNRPPYCSTSLFHDSSLQGFLHYENGHAYLIGQEGQLTPLDDPKKCLQIGIDAMRHSCPSLPFTAGVKLKLEAMAAAWGSI